MSYFALLFWRVHSHFQNPGKQLYGQGLSGKPLAYALSQMSSERPKRTSWKKLEAPYGEVDDEADADIISLSSQSSGEGKIESMVTCSSLSSIPATNLFISLCFISTPHRV